MHALTLSLTLFSLTSIGSGQSTFKAGRDWPQFRGPDARGIALTRGAPPAAWDVESGEGVVWRVEVPGLAHSSPIVWGDRLFVTTALRVDGDSELSSLYGSPGYGSGDSVPAEGTHSFLLLCLDKNTGKVLWTREAHRGVPQIKRHPKSTHANSTPACDGEVVVAFFGSEGLFAYDHEGELLWKKGFGKLDSAAPGIENPEGFEWGFASSPVLYAGKVVVQCDVESQSFLAVLDAKTGEELWRTDRDEDSTWGTPTVHAASAGEGAQVIVNGYRHIGGYELANGASIWKLVGGGDVPVPTPIVDEGMIYMTSAHGRYRPIYAIHADAKGLITAEPSECEAMEWCHMHRGIYMQTPLVSDSILYACSDGGILAVYDALSGDQIYRQRLGDGRAGFSASAVMAEDHLYFTDEGGTVHVLRAGPEYERLGTNSLGETCLATPAISDDRLYFRTRNHLVCVGE